MGSVNRTVVDSGFIKGLPQDNVQKSSVKAFIGLAQNLKLGTVAEGVETSAQSECLAALGCDTVQGYWLGKPLSDVSFRQLLSNRRPPQAEDCIETSFTTG